jgi:hypothetical protein
VLAELIVGLVVVAPHGGFLERPVHSFDLTVRPGMIGLGQPVFDAMTLTSSIEWVTAPDGGRPRSVLWEVGELDAVVGQDDVDLVGNGLDQFVEERCRGNGIGSVDQPGEGDLRRPVDGNEQVELAFFRAYLGDIEVEEPDRVDLEGLLRRLVAIDLGQSGNTVTLQAAMQGRTGQVRDAGLQGIEAIIQRQQGMLAEGDNDRLFLLGEHRGFWRLWSHWRIGDHGPALPLGDRLGVHPEAAGQGPYARLTMLYRSTDRLCRAGAPMKNLAHVPSLSMARFLVPSYTGTEHLAVP